MTDLEILEIIEPIIKNLARKYKCQEFPFEDLCQIGRLAAIKHGRRYDKTKGTKLTTWLYYKISREIIDEKNKVLFYGKDKKRIQIEFSECENFSEFKDPSILIDLKYILRQTMIPKKYIMVLLNMASRRKITPSTTGHDASAAGILTKLKLEVSKREKICRLRRDNGKYRRDAK
jgi:hypothetical protein